MGSERKKSRAAPQRMCIGCRRREAKAHLVRLALRQGRLVIDTMGTMPGRGGYLHPGDACATEFSRRGGVVRSLRCVIAREQRLRVAEEIRQSLTGMTDVHWRAR